jgi:hypothetical protein
MKQWYCHIGGQQYGPVSEEQLRAWAREGRLRPTDSVWCEGMSGWAPASTVEGLLFAILPPPPPVRPHRGGAVLALGTIGMVCCFICGIIAWVMANSDLKEMAAGRMDRSGEGTTKAGRVCGIISVVMLAVAVLLNLIAILASRRLTWYHHHFMFPMFPR